MEPRVKQVFDGLSLVAVGLVFLANTTGALPWSVWLNIISLWPLLLVAAGIDLVGKSLGSTWVRVLSSVVFIGGLAYAVFLMPADGWPGTFGVDLAGREAVESSGSAGTAEGLVSAEARVEAPVGRFTIGSGRAGRLVSWDGRSPYGETTVDVSEEGSSAVVTVRAARGPRVFLGPGRGARFDLLLSEEVTWTVKVDAGVGELEADLSDLALEGFEVESGVGNGTITLGEPVARGSRVRAGSGIASLTLRVPRGAEGRVRISSGIGSRDLPGRFERAGDGTWATPGYDGAVRSWDIVVESGIGSLRVETY
ncbi:MAG: hypothetical protein IBX62_02230 [Coriobacteriia bacterium]|nr:hypothetical protein [Coriobacteriia bacterium]